MRKRYDLKRLLTGVLLSCIILIALPAVSQTITFQKLYGGARIESGRDLEICSNGDYLMAGISTSFSPGDSDVYVLRVDKEGNKLLEKAYGGRGNDMAYSIRHTNDGNFIVGGFTTSYGAGGVDAYLLKISNSADVLWSKTYGGVKDDYIREACPTSDGGYILTGYSNNNGNYDAFLIKTDASGNQQWIKYYGGAYTETSFSVKQTRDGGYIMFGSTFSSGAGGGDFYLVKTDGSGNEVWSKVFGGPAVEEGQFVLCTDDEGFIMVGDQESYTAGSFDINVSKFDANGEKVWSKLFGGNAKDVGKMVQPTSDGGYIISGITRSFGLGEPDFWLIKIDGAGNMHWNKTYGYAYHEHAYPAKQTSDGGYIVAGHSDSPPSAGIDLFLVKTDSEGKVTVGVDENEIQAVISAYPNPGADRIRVNLSALPRDNYRLTLLNAIGQEVYNTVIGKNDLNEPKEIDIGMFPRGLYLVTLSDRFEKKRVAKKIIFQ